jgi:sugar lactone lactonase YvrE
MSHVFKLKTAKAAFMTLFMTSLISCDRLAKDQSATVTLAMPKTLQKSSGVSAQSATLVAQHIVVNITGADMPTAYQALDANRDNRSINCDPNNPAPGTLSLTVPQGSSRLIQVLVAYCDSSSSSAGMAIYYGSVKQDLKGAEINVEVPVQQVGDAIAVDGSIMGRYLSDASTGPTGSVNIMYQPPQEPAMIVEQDEIFGGWFRFFALQSGGFNYVLEDGTPLFTKATTTDSYPAPQVGVVHLPPSFKNQSYSGGLANYKAQDAQQMVVGFFGAGSSGKKMCAHSYNSTIPYLYADAAGAEAILWSGATASTTAGYISGGDPVSSCIASGIVNQDYLQLDLSKISNRDSAFGFRGPFKIPATGNGSPVSGTQSSTSVSLNWSYMPGAIHGIDGVEIFYKWIASGSNDSRSAPYYTDHGIDCDQLASNGFYDYGPAPAPSVADAVTATIAIGASPGPNLLPNFILCPYRLNAPGRPAQRSYFKAAGEWSGGAFPLVVQHSSSMSVAGMTGNLAVDSSGNVFYANTNGSTIVKVDPSGTQTVFAGNGSYSNVDGTGTAASFGYPYLVATDSNDNIYVADANKIRKITPGQVVTTVTTMPDGGTPRGIAADSSGNVYYVWDNYGSTTHVILKITPGGTITTLAGSGTAGDVNGTGASASFNTPNDLVVDSAGNIFVADTGNYKIKKITPGGVVTAFAGSGVQGMSNGIGSAASFFFSGSSGYFYSHMGIDGSNNIYIGDMDMASPNGRNFIRKIASDATVTTYCGVVSGPMNVGGCATVSVYSRFGVAVGIDGTVYFADTSSLNKILK